MTQMLGIHPVNPQLRLIRHVVDCLNKGGVIVYPTDSAYALGCPVGDKAAMDKIRTLRALDKHHNFTLVCSDLSELATYARVNNTTYRLLKANTPGAYTFILPATNEVPRRLQHPKRKTIGLRVPDNAIVQALLGEYGAPILSVTLMLPGQQDPMTDPNEIHEVMQGKVELIIDGGYCGLDPSTVIDMTESHPVILREGKGDVSPFI